LRRPLILIVVLFMVSIAGCATKDDVQTLRRNIFALQEQVSELKKAVEENRKSEKLVRKSQADMGADIIDLRGNVQELRGVTEELKVGSMSLKTGPVGQELRKLNEELGDNVKRIEVVENYLGIEKNERVIQKEKEKTPLKETVDREKIYSEAYRIFKDGKYDSARRKFQEFLKSFPNAEYSDNAQFWIGECYYFERNYEKAILEYEKVVQNYPKGNKVPNALLKQALSFLKLDDKSSSMLLLQRVIKEYPNTNAARIARSKLVDIK
jgi:tol-pal system protein YbgF